MTSPPTALFAMDPKISKAHRPIGTFTSNMYASVGLECLFQEYTYMFMLLFVHHRSLGRPVYIGRKAEFDLLVVRTLISRPGIR